MCLSGSPERVHVQCVLLGAPGGQEKVCGTLSTVLELQYKSYGHFVRCPMGAEDRILCKNY